MQSRKKSATASNWISEYEHVIQDSSPLKAKEQASNQPVTDFSSQRFEAL